MLPPEVRHEPRLALDGGPDGLTSHRRIIAEASALLRPGGCLILEIDPAQAEPLTGLLRGHGTFADVAVVPDLAGRARVIIARYAGSGEIVDDR
jgi:release factor glutamine methyltransferase